MWGLCVKWKVTVCACVVAHTLFSFFFWRAVFQVTEWVPLDRTGGKGGGGGTHFEERSPQRARGAGEGPAGRVQRGRGSLLMMSHLRPPFTLNMGCCCLTLALIHQDS